MDKALQCHVFSAGSPPAKKKGRLTRSKKQTSRKTSSTTTDDGEEKREDEDRKRKAVPKQTSEEREDELNKTQSDEEMAQACEHVEQEVSNIQTVHFTRVPTRTGKPGKMEGIFQSGKSQEIFTRLEKLGKITQNTGKLCEFQTNVICFFFQ